MTIKTLDPHYITPAELVPALRRDGYGVLNAASVSAFVNAPLTAFAALRSDWDSLPPDNFLKDGGRYRSRRHASFIVTAQQANQVPHRPHYQPLAYNALHGGMLRHFDPMLDSTVAQPVWTQLLVAIGQVCSAVKGEQPWYVEAHQFRIDTRHGIGRPTPEGAHRDGVDFVAILLVDKQHVSGGESRIFAADGPHGQRFTLSQPWTLLILDDQSVIHESTPIQAVAEGGHRDTLVLTYRAQGFLDPDA